jgi:hypothetical protein
MVQIYVRTSHKTSEASYGAPFTGYIDNKIAFFWDYYRVLPESTNVSGESVAPIFGLEGQKSRVEDYSSTLQRKAAYLFETSVNFYPITGLTSRKMELFIITTSRTTLFVNHLVSGCKFMQLKSNKTEVKINECCEEVKI